MNRQEIEQRFDERFANTGIDVLDWPIKSFFFDEILPEVLKDIYECPLAEDEVKAKYNITL